MLRPSALISPALLLAIMAGTASMHPASATDLTQAWQAAQLHDQEFAAAKAGYDASSTHKDQAAALWRPSVALTAVTGRQSSDTEMTGAQFSAPGFGLSTGVNFNTSIHNGNLEQLALVARQPLLNRGLLAQSRQLSLSAQAADSEWENARHNLFFRVAERYFDVIIANETVRLLRQQQTAVAYALNEVKEKFKLGSAPVTDTYEATARAETIKAQLLAAEMDLQIKQAMLSDMTELPSHDLAVPDLLTRMESLSLPALETCLSEAALYNPTLRVQEKTQAIAQEEAIRQSHTSDISLDLVAQLGHNRLNGSGDFGDAVSTGTNRMIGIQLTVPLYTGGYRSAKYAEALHLINKTSADSELLQQQIRLKTRTAWLGITVGISRISALKQASKASASRLDATRTGHAEGDRTTLDLLNAESEAMAAELAVLQAQTSVALDRLRLAQLTGSTEEKTLNIFRH